MSTELTTLGFVALTAIAVAVHLRGRSNGAPERAACPRCGEEVSGAGARCPACGVPQQIFEVAAAPKVDEGPAADGEAERPHGVVRADVCVGCGSCVAACPEEGAIRLEGKLAVIDRERCVGHGACAEACPVGGILITTGAMVHRVVVPDVGEDFQSNVPGVYVAGELGGRGLIKNAINEGRLAAENVVRALREEGPCPVDPADPEPALDLAIVGSGPAGLSAGLEAHRSGLDYVILEQGTLADSIRKYPRRKLLLAEPLRVPLFGDLWVADATKEQLLTVWERIIGSAGLRIRTGCRVEEVCREEGVLVLRGEGFEVRARRVILALGRRGTPRRLGVPGEESDRVFYDVVEMEAFRGRRVLVVGGGDSALESAVGLSLQPGTDVVLSYRGEDFRRAKARNVRKLEEAENSGRLRVLRRSRVKEIRPGMVLLEVEGETLSVPNDDVVVRIGGEPPARLLERTGIRTVTKELPVEDARESVGA